MKKILSVLVIAVALLTMAAPAFANEEHTCDHSAVTIDSLHHCVMHAFEMGHIAKAGVSDSLLARLDAAQAALDRGQPDVAINLLRAFINEVNAQAGKAIASDHAAHLVGHAQNVIAALAG